LVNSAARSGAYLYPIKGIVYFVSHRALWKPLLSRLAPAFSLSLGVVTFMFFFTYLPQLAVSVFVNGPLAVFSTILLVLSESSTLISLISRQFLVADALLDTFDGTLVAKGQINVVKGGRQLHAGGDSIERLGKVLKSPFERFSPKALIRYVMYLPLNFIPSKFGHNGSCLLHDEVLTSLSRRHCYLRPCTGADEGSISARSLFPAEGMERGAEGRVAEGTVRILESGLTSCCLG
jgi:hypothetical protein